MKILKGTSKLKDADENFKRISIDQDLITKQRAHKKILVAEAKRQG